MISFRVNDHVYELDAEELKSKLIPAIEAKLTEVAGGAGMLKSTVKSAVSMVLGFMGIHNTTGEDTLTFAAKLVLDGALTELEKTGLAIEAREVKAVEPSTDQPK